MRTTRLQKAAVAAATTTLVLGAGAGAAHAAKVPLVASGTTTIQLNGPTFKALTTNGCGTLGASALGSATVKITGAGKFQANLPVTSLLVTSAGHARIEHAGSGVELSNSCYDVRLSNFYVQDLGAGQEQSVAYDVSAKTKSSDPDETGQRQVLFHLDGSMVRVTGTFKKDRVVAKLMGFDVLLGDEGAAEFNQLATGSETSGPFTSGGLVGKARTTVRLPFDQMVDESALQAPAPSDPGSGDTGSGDTPPPTEG